MMFYTTEHNGLIEALDANNNEELARATQVHGANVETWIVEAEFGPFHVQRTAHDTPTANVRVSQFATLAYLVQCENITPERAVLLLTRQGA